MRRLKLLKQKVIDLEIFLDGIARSVIEENKAEIIAEIQDQLMRGEDGYGQSIHPTYLEDPYFKTKEAAEAYMAWKQKLTPNPDRKPESPNLYINGYFHESLSLRIESEAASVASDWIEGKTEIIPKYGSETFKLQDSALQIIVVSVIKKRIRSKLMEFK